MQYTLSQNLSGLAAAIPCLVIAYIMVGVWIEPMAWDNGSWVPYAIGLLGIEFLILHSSVFISHMLQTRDSTEAKFKLFAVLLGMYTLMGIGFAIVAQSQLLLLALVAVMIGRFVNALTGTPHNQARAAFGIVVYMAVVGGTVFVDVPEMGISSSVLAEVYPNRGGGVWERHPERAVAGAAVYFAVMGMAELYWIAKGVSTRANR